MVDRVAYAFRSFHDTTTTIDRRPWGNLISTRHDSVSNRNEIGVHVWPSLIERLVSPIRRPFHYRPWRSNSIDRNTFVDRGQCS